MFEFWGECSCLYLYAVILPAFLLKVFKWVNFPVTAQDWMLIMVWTIHYNIYEKAVQYGTSTEWASLKSPMFCMCYVVFIEV